MKDTAKEVHFDGKVAQKAIIERQGRVLVVRNPREERELWELPGGRLNKRENVRSGLQREVKEELGVDVAVGRVVHLAQFFQHSEGKNALMIAYEAHLLDEAQELVLEEGEVCEVRWVDKTEASKLKFFDEYEVALQKYFEEN